MKSTSCIVPPHYAVGRTRIERSIDDSNITIEDALGFPVGTGNAEQERAAGPFYEQLMQVKATKRLVCSGVGKTGVYRNAVVIVLFHTYSIPVMLLFVCKYCLILPDGL